MQHSTVEVNKCAKDDAQGCCNIRYAGVRGSVLAGLVILTVLRASPALAGEQVAPAVSAAKPNPSALEFTPTSGFILPLPSYQSVPSSYRAVDLPVPKSFSAAEFRPRGHSMLEKNSPLVDPEAAPMLQGTTVWQRLSDYRSHDRVRVVTLWEAGGSSVSLQAGRRGDPSLQWTSRLMNHGGATRGLLDQMFSTSLGGVARGLHLVPRAAGPEAFAPKPIETAFGNAGTVAK